MTDGRTIGLVSDIHANLPALEAVLADMPAVDALVHAGDVVGYGPWPGACIDRLRARDTHAIRGNHDDTVFEDPTYGAGDQYAREVLSDDNRAWLEGLPHDRTLFDGRLQVVHGHPEERYRYTRPIEFDESLLGHEDVLVLGHTHDQAKEGTDDGVVVNPGSVGQPRDRDPRAAYALLDLPSLEVTLRRVEYDIDRVAEKLEETPISQYNAQRLREGR